MRRKKPKKTRGNYGQGSLSTHELADGRYRYSYLFWRDGQRVRSPRFDTEDEVWDWVAEYRGSRGAIASKDTFAAVAEEWLGGRAANPTKLAGDRGMFRNHILPVFGHRKLADITTADINHYITGKETGTLPVKGGAKAKLGRTSIAQHVSMIRSVFEYALDQRYMVGRNPAARNRSGKLKALRPQKKKPRALGRVEWADLWEATPEDDQAHVAALALMGLRSQEAAALRWRDFNRSSLTIERARKSGGTIVGVPKTDSSNRTLRCSEQMVELLRAHYHRQKAAGRDTGPDALIFPNDRGGVIDPANFRRKLAAISKAAGVRTVKPHELRHTFAVNQINDRINIAHIARMLGHRDAVTTLREYIDYMDTDLPPVAEVELSAARARRAARAANRRQAR